MEGSLLQLSKWFGPAILALPSPSIPAPANWLVPLAIYLAIVRFALKTLLSSEWKWLGERLLYMSTEIFKRVSRALEYPGRKDRRPLREMVGALGVCIVHYAFALYFFIWSTVAGLTAALSIGSANSTQSFLWVVLWLLPLLVACFYRSRGSEHRRELVRSWRAYRQKGVKAYAALSAVPLMCTVISFGVGLVQGN